MPDLSELYALDVAVAVVVLLSAWIAYMRGFVREVFVLASWIGAIAATVTFYPQASEFARQHIASMFAADLAAGIGLFLGTLILLRVVLGGIAEAVANSEHNTLDRSAGFLFGIFRGCLLVVAAYMAYSWLVSPEEHKAWITEAKTLPLIKESAQELEMLLPTDFLGGAEREAARARALNREAAELERLHQRFNVPAPQAPETDAQTDNLGYNAEDRRGLDAFWSTPAGKIDRDRTER